jgi:hypothetical protein
MYHYCLSPIVLSSPKVWVKEIGHVHPFKRLFEKPHEFTFFCCVRKVYLRNARSYSIALNDSYCCPVSSEIELKNENDDNVYK